MTLALPYALVASLAACAADGDGASDGDQNDEDDDDDDDDEGEEDGSGNGGDDDGGSEDDGSSDDDDGSSDDGEGDDGEGDDSEGDDGEGDDGGAPDGGPGGEACAEPGAVGNELGIGTYCTPGGGECDATEGAPICTVDYEDGVPQFCTTPCFSDDDCGSEASCEDNGGPLSGCTPACLLEP